MLSNFNFPLNYDLVLYGLIISTAILLGFVFIKTILANGFNMAVNSESNTITVIPNQNTRIMSNSDIVNYRLEIALPKEQIQEIKELLGPDMIDNVITGSNSDYIINTYIIPHIASSNINELIFEIFNHFNC
jgi:hypothetical protein